VHFSSLLNRRLMFLLWPHSLIRASSVFVTWRKSRQANWARMEVCTCDWETSKRTARRQYKPTDAINDLAYNLFDKGEFVVVFVRHFSRRHRISVLVQNRSDIIGCSSQSLIYCQWINLSESQFCVHFGQLWINLQKHENQKLVILN
jgi:hypothetical protein